MLTQESLLSLWTGRSLFFNAFGWRNREGGKRFTRAIVSVARGQGKTYLMAILMCYSYLIESLGLSNQDYLVASINFKQTNKLYGYIKSMLRQIAVTEPFKSLADETELSTQSDQTIEKGRIMFCAQYRLNRDSLTHTTLLQLSLTKLAK